MSFVYIWTLVDFVGPFDGSLVLKLMFLIGVYYVIVLL